MISARKVLGRAAILAAALAAIAAPAQTPASPSTQAAVRWRDVSMEDYRQHLQALSTLVDTCATARNLKSCDPSLIGPDDRVPLANGSSTRAAPRAVWLAPRVVFES